jgi:hypothetical protein
MTPRAFKAPEAEADSETLTEQDGNEAVALIMSVARKLGLAQRFTDGSLTAKEQRDLLHAVSEDVSADLRASAETMLIEIAPVKGVRSSVSSFFAKARKVIRTAALAAAMIFTGPSMASMPADVQSAVITQVARQDAYLADFEQEVRGGQQPANGTIVSRAGMYGQATWAVGLNTLAAVAEGRGMVSERLVLGEANHCQECPEDAGLGWVAIGELKPIGSRQCLVGCRCHLEYRDAKGRVYEVPT